MFKSQSSHELLYQKKVANSVSCNTNNNTTDHLMNQTNHTNHSNHSNHNFLYVPGQLPNGQLSREHSNCSSSTSIKMSCSASESSDCSVYSDTDNHDSSYDLKKHKKLQKSIRKQKKKNQKQLTELIQFLHSNDTNINLKFDEEDLKYLSISRNSINGSMNKSLNEYLDPDSETYRNEKSIPMSRSMDFNFYQNQNNSSNASFASLQPGQHPAGGVHFNNNHHQTNGQYERPTFGNSDRVTEDEDEEVNFDEENEKTITNGDRLTSNGYRRVRRFGKDVEDGCGFPLSLQFLKEVNGRSQLVPANGNKEDTLKKVKTWPELLEEANEFVAKQLNIDPCAHMHCSAGLANVCPFPEMEFASVPSVLPFRRWNSELNLTIKQKNQIQKNENHFITNQLDTSSSTNHLWKSCEDLRHLTSGNLNLANEKLLPFNYDMIYSNNLFKLNSKSKHFNCNSSDLNYTSSSNSSWRISSSSSNSSSMSGVSNLIGMDMNTLINNPWEVFLQNFSPKLVAIELTKIEIDLFLHLNCTEISREIFAPTRSLNITQYFEIHCIYLFVQLILKQDQLSKRTTCLKLCIDLLGELYKLKNWQSFKSVLIALHCIPIIRLKQTWMKLNAIYPSAYEEFQKLSRFNLCNHDHHLLHNHNQLSIPCLSELLNEIRARIAFKLNQVNCKPKLFAKPETLTDWLTCEVRNLENLLIMNQAMSPTEDKRLDKDKMKKSNIIKKLLRSFNSKKKKMKQKTALAKQQEIDVDHLSVNNLSKNNLNNLSTNPSSVDLNHLKTVQLNEKDLVDDELILMKTINSNNCLEEWREIQMDLKIKLNKLKPEVENSILNEINKCLELHQTFVLNYKFSNSEFSDSSQEKSNQEESKASIIRRCLLQLVKLNSNSMQELMKISLKVEPHED